MIKHLALGDHDEHTGPPPNPKGPYLNVEVTRLPIGVIENVAQLYEEMLDTIKGTTILVPTGNQYLKVIVDREENYAKEVIAMFVYWGGPVPLDSGNGMFTRVHDRNLEDVLDCLQERPGCNDLVVLCVDP